MDDTSLRVTLVDQNLTENKIPRRGSHVIAGVEKLRRRVRIRTAIVEMDNACPGPSGVEYPEFSSIHARSSGVISTVNRNQGSRPASFCTSRTLSSRPRLLDARPC